MDHLIHSMAPDGPLLHPIDGSVTIWLYIMNSATTYVGINGCFFGSFLTFIFDVQSFTLILF